jgi:ribosomal protein S18 acetylase RimI-like enzyme
MKEIQIIKLPLNRWKEYKNLRYEAVTNNPCAFLHTPEETKTKKKDAWTEHLKNALNQNASSTMFFAEDEDRLVGMIAGFFDDKEKTRHVGNIVSFYVKPEYRGYGIGSKLMNEIIKWYKSKTSIKKIKLSVYTTNPAVKIYQKYGFKIVGELHKEIKVGDEFHDEYHMEKFL